MKTTIVTRTFNQTPFPRAVRLALGALTSLGALACGDNFGATPTGEVGSVMASLAIVPTGVGCIRMVLSGTTAATRDTRVTGGSTATKVVLGNLPTGTLGLASSAYSVDCPAVTAAMVPSWIGVPLATNVLPGLTTEVAIVLRPNVPVSAKVDFVSPPVSMGAGAQSTYAVISDGTVRAWGDNSSGQLGDGTVVSRSLPVVVSGLSGTATVSGGTLHACALNTTGQARCWGANADGQAGTGNTVAALTPALVSGGLTFRGLVTGGYHTCGWTAAGNYCWGWNGYGQLGDGTQTFRSSPVMAVNLPGEPMATSAMSDSTFSLSGKSTWVNGANRSGLLGVGQKGGFLATMKEYQSDLLLNGPRFLVGAAVGQMHACVVDAVGKVFCTGDNTAGQIGADPTGGSFNLPIDANIDSVASLTVGMEHTCALKVDGSVWCWGAGAEGQLGNGLAVNRKTPNMVIGLESGVVSIVAGKYHTCALKNDATMWCWGNNAFGQLGDGTKVSRGVPTKVLL